MLNLPNETLEQIFQYVPHPFGTRLLLLSRRLACLLMYEQVRHLEFNTHEQLSHWLTTVEETSGKNATNTETTVVTQTMTSTNVMCYVDLIGKTEEVEMRRGDGDAVTPADLPARLARFLMRCGNLRRVYMGFYPNNGRDSHDWIIQPIFRSLPPSVQYIDVDCRFTFTKVASFQTLVTECLPRLRELKGLRWVSARAEERDVRDLLARAPRLQNLDMVTYYSVLTDATLDAAMRLCPELRNISFKWARNLSNEKIVEWLRSRAGRTTTLNLVDRNLADSFLVVVAPLCPNLRCLDLSGAQCFSMLDLRGLLNCCRRLIHLSLPCVEHPGEGIAWDAFNSWMGAIPSEFLYYKRRIAIIEGANVDTLRDMLDDLCTTELKCGSSWPAYVLKRDVWVRSQVARDTSKSREKPAPRTRV